MTQTVETIWLTKDAFEKKTAELADLRGPVRSDIVARISAARDEGDLKENGGYHAAREELAKLEGRIAQLEQVLAKADVGNIEDDGLISPGFKVSYHFVGDDTIDTFLLGAREMADGDIQVFSPQSPLGTAIMGAKVGDTVSYQAPSGKAIKIVIVEAAPYQG